jgi:hypothetical protein
VWRQNNNLSLNVSKIKEPIFRRSEHAPIHIDGDAVEQFESFKFLGV